jgi:hypothetical protein
LSPSRTTTSRRCLTNQQPAPGAFQQVSRSLVSAIRTCNWPRRARLAFDAELTAHPDETVDLAAVRDVCATEEIRPGVNFAAQQQSNFYVESAVAITQDSLPVRFTGTAPRLYGCYYGVWRLPIRAVTRW